MTSLKPRKPNLSPLQDILAFLLYKWWRQSVTASERDQQLNKCIWHNGRGRSPVSSRFISLFTRRLSLTSIVQYQKFNINISIFWVMNDFRAKAATADGDWWSEGWWNLSFTRLRPGYNWSLIGKWNIWLRFPLPTSIWLIKMMKGGRFRRNSNLTCLQFK